PTSGSASSGKSSGTVSAKLPRAWYVSAADSRIENGTSITPTLVPGSSAATNVTTSGAVPCTARGARKVLRSSAGTTTTWIGAVCVAPSVSKTVSSKLNAVSTSTSGAVKLTVVRDRVTSGTPAGPLQRQSSSGPSGSSLSRPVSSTSAPSRTAFVAPLFMINGRAIGTRFTLLPTLLGPEPLLHACASHAQADTNTTRSAYRLMLCIALPC